MRISWDRQYNVATMLNEIGFSTQNTQRFARNSGLIVVLIFLNTFFFKGNKHFKLKKYRWATEAYTNGMEYVLFSYVQSSITLLGSMSLTRRSFFLSIACG